MMQEDLGVALMEVIAGDINLRNFEAQRWESPDRETREKLRKKLRELNPRYQNQGLKKIWNPENYNKISECGKTMHVLLLTSAEEVRLLLESIEDEEMRTDVINWKYWPFFNAALHLASEKGHLEVVRLLIENKCNVNITDYHKKTALHLASANGHLEVARLLIENKCDVDMTDDAKRTALYLALEKGHLEVVRLLIENKCDVNMVYSGCMTALHLALQKGHLEVVKLLIEKKCDVNMTDDSKRTALHLASLGGHLEVVRLLIENKCDVNMTDYCKMTALHWASLGGHFDVVRLLIENKCDISITDKSNRTALHCASEKGHIEVVKVLLLQGNCDVNLRNRSGDTALDVALRSRSGQVVKLLMCLITESNKEKISFLLLTSNSELEHFIENNWDVNVQDKRNQTVLHGVARKGATKAVEFLLDNNCDANLKNIEDETALHLASSNGHIPVVRLLLESKLIDLEVEDFLGRTALFRSVEKQQEGITDVLLSAGATFTAGHLKTALNMNSSQVINTLLKDAKFELNGFLKVIVDGANYSTLRNETFKKYVSDKEIKEDVIAMIVINTENDLNLFSIASKNNIHELVKLVIPYARCPEISEANPSPFWLAANGGHKETMELLVKQKECMNFKKMAPDGTTPLVMMIAKGHSHLLSLFEELYDDVYEIVQECVKFGNMHMISKLHKKIDINKNMVFLKDLLQKAIISDSVDSFKYVKSLLGDLPMDQEERCCIQIRKELELTTEFQSAALVRMSQDYPVFNTKVEFDWTANWKPRTRSSKKEMTQKEKYLNFSKDVITKVIKRACCLPEELAHYIADMALPVCSQSCKQKEDCEVLRELLSACKRLQSELINGDYDGNACIRFLEPQFFLIGSTAEGTRLGKVSEADITIKFNGLNESPFRIRLKATDLLLPLDLKARQHMQKFCKEGTVDVFDYSMFLHFLLKAISVSLRNMALNEYGLEISQANDKYKPCDNCNEVSFNDDSKSIYTPHTLCTKCLPVVTHTKIGPCLVFKKRSGKKKGNYINVTIDLIPVYPIDEQDTLKLFTLVTKTLIENTPPFWLDYFKSLMERDIILPENQTTKNEQKQLPEAKQGYQEAQGVPDINSVVAIKLLHYGPDDNYIIRPGQDMEIQQFKIQLLKDVYIYMKGLKDLLKISAKSYFMKQVVLLPDFVAKVQQQMATQEEVEVKSSKKNEVILARLVFDALSHPDLVKLFEERIDFVKWKEELDKKHGDIVPLK